MGEAMAKTIYQPDGIDFYDAASGRLLKLVTAGPWRGWLAYLHPDGQWVSLRKATLEDLHAIDEAGKARLKRTLADCDAAFDELRQMLESWQP